MPATEPFPWLDLDGRSELPAHVHARIDDPAERLVRRFFDACESPEKRKRADRLLRRGARSALRGTTRYSLVNRIVANRISRLAGIDNRARKMQLVSAHLLGIAYIRYVFKLEPIASMDYEEVVALSVPVIRYYLDGANAATIAS